MVKVYRILVYAGIYIYIYMCVSMSYITHNEVTHHTPYITTRSNTNIFLSEIKRVNACHVKSIFVSCLFCILVSIQAQNNLTILAYRSIIYSLL